MSQLQKLEAELSGDRAELRKNIEANEEAQKQQQESIRQLSAKAASLSEQNEKETQAKQLLSDELEKLKADFNAKEKDMTEISSQLNACKKNLQQSVAEKEATAIELEK